MLTSQSSHFFFQIKTDGESDRLKLKCRFVPHGNWDKEKDDIRKDSATAQFPFIRALLSAAVILRLRIATINISCAYLQVPLNRDVYVRLPKGWTRSPFIVWKLLVPAYCLVDSGRLWQLAVEEWMEDNGVYQVHGMPQIFVERRLDGSIVLVIAKVVEDFLIAGLPESLRSFHDVISRRFQVGPFVESADLVFNRLHIHQDKDFSITVSMAEYLEKLRLSRSTVVGESHKTPNVRPPNSLCSRKSLDN